MTGMRRVQDGALAEHRPPADPGSLGDHAPAADHGVVPDDHRGGLGRLEDAADAHTSREMDLRADLGARPDRGPGVDHGAGPHPGADVDVARHEDDPAAEERTPAGRGPGHDPDAGRGVARFSGSLSANSNGPTSMVSMARSRKSRRMAVLQPLVDDDLAGGGSISATRASPGSSRSMASVTTARASVSRRAELARRGPTALDLGLEVGHGPRR